MTLELDTAAAAIVTDHPFVPRGEWFEVCGHYHGIRFALGDTPRSVYCDLAEAAHASTTLHHDEEAKGV